MVSFEAILKCKSFLAFFFCGLVFFILIKAIANVFIAWKIHKKKPRSNQSDSTFIIERLRFFVFLKLFANCLTLSFFPQYLIRTALHSHASLTWASFAFALYQLIFMIMIIPSGYLMEQQKVKRILLLATGIEVMILIAFGFANHIIEIFILQILFGFLVPISSAAEYAYIFQFSNEKNRNHSVALYTNSLRGATIAGIAAGGFLASRVGMIPVFFVASSMVFFSWLYLIFFIPSILLVKRSGPKEKPRKITLRTILIGLYRGIQEPNFLKIITCVGIPSGILEEGIVFFCLPLFLSFYHFTSEQIGQLLVLFPVGFFLTNRFVASWADSAQSEKNILSLGLMGVALALMLLFLGQTKIFLVLSLLLLGFFRGFLLSPAIASVSKSVVTDELGRNVSVALYRFSETLGKCIGPLLLGQILFIKHYSYQLFIGLSLLYFIAALSLFKKH